MSLTIKDIQGGRAEMLALRAGRLRFFYSADLEGRDCANPNRNGM